jgi:hypothetical protein
MKSLDQETPVTIRAGMPLTCPQHLAPCKAIHSFFVNPEENLKISLNSRVNLPIIVLYHSVTGRASFWRQSGQISRLMWQV